MPQYRTYATEANARRRRDILCKQAACREHIKFNIYCVIPAPDRSFRYCVALMWASTGPLAGQVRAYCE